MISLRLFICALVALLGLQAVPTFGEGRRSNRA